MNHLNQPWIFRGYSLVLRGVFQFLFWRFKYLHPRKQTNIPWKLMVGRWQFAFKILKWSPFSEDMLSFGGVRLDDNDSTVAIYTFLSSIWIYFCNTPPPKMNACPPKRDHFLKEINHLNQPWNFQGMFLSVQGYFKFCFGDLSTYTPES